MVSSPLDSSGRTVPVRTTLNLETLGLGNGGGNWKKGLSGESNGNSWFISPPWSSERIVVPAVGIVPTIS